MSLRSKAVTVFAKAEVTYGTPVALVAADAIRTRGATIRPLEGQALDRELDGPSFGSTGKIHVGTHVIMEFDVEMAGSGIAGTPPKYAHLFLSCGMSQTIVPTTSVTLAPATQSTSSHTFYFQLDGQRHAMRGARGTWSIRFDSQGIPYFRFVFTGVWVDPASATDIVPVWTGWTTPRPVSYAHTPAVQLHGLTAVFRSFSFDYGNQVNHFDNPGEEDVAITDRMCTGTIALRAPTLTAKNYFTTARADTKGALTLVHGMTAGNIITLEGQQVQLLQPRYGDDRGRAMIETNLEFCIDAADDEVELVFT